MLKKFILLNFLLFTAAFTIKAQTTAAPKESMQTDAALRRQSFEKVWNTVNEKHFDPTFGGVDWQKMREIYEPQASAAKSDAELHGILSRMLNELKLSHFNIVPRSAEIKTENAGKGIVGIDVKMIDGKAVVARVEKNSTAEAANLKTGFIIEKIGGKSVGELLAPLDKSLAERNEDERLSRLYREKTLVNFTNGLPESIVRIEASDEKNQTRVFEIKRYPAKSEMSEALGNFPPQEVVFESRRLDNNIGYIRFNMWTIPQAAKIRQAIKEFAGAPGIVFDLRGNPGGVGGIALGAAGLLTGEQTTLGSMNSRAGEQKFIVYPQNNAFLGKIVIIIDHGSASTSEIFAAGMQEIGRAKVIGERSAGAVLPSVFEILPTGAIFQYAVSDYKSPKNILIEKRGVIPDVEVGTTRRMLLEGRDAPVEKAVEIITK